VLPCFVEIVRRASVLRAERERERLSSDVERRTRQEHATGGD
jgi:hypothetical protein